MKKTVNTKLHLNNTFRYTAVSLNQQNTKLRLPYFCVTSRNPKRCVYFKRLLLKVESQRYTTARGTCKGSSELMQNARTAPASNKN